MSTLSSYAISEAPVGTRIHVFLSHDLERFDDAAATMARLDVALPAAFAVRDYWRRIDPPAHEHDGWEAEPIAPRLPDLRRYDGPGSLQVTVTPVAARIGTGGRWRGFLSIPPLREVHLVAFRAIARALGSSKMAVCADARDDVTEVFLANGSQDACIAQLQSALGPPQASMDAIAPEIVAETEHGVPGVWFLETLGEMRH